MGILTWIAKVAVADAAKADALVVSQGPAKPLSLAGGEAWRETQPYAGEHVTEASAMALSAVWACANLVCGTISSLPFQVYRERSDGYRERQSGHPLYRVIHDAPNYDQTAVDFWDFINLCIELRGNAYAEIKRAADGRVIALRPLKPDSVSVRRDENGTLRYRWTMDGKPFERGEDDVLHIRGPGGDPLGGMSTLSFGAQAFSSAQAAERAAAGMFRNGMRPSGVIKFKDWLSPERRQLVNERFGAHYIGAINAGRPVILEGETDFTPLSISPEDAQMLETRGFSVEEVCRFFGVPPVMIGHTSKTTSWPTGVEQQVLLFQKFTLRRRLKRIEQAVSMKLLSTDDRAAGVIVEFNLEGLLRGDSVARSEFYSSGLGNGWLTINEVRARENLPPVEGGDVPRMQMQNVPITEAVGKGATNADEAR